MSKLLVVILCGFMFVTVGCKAKGEIEDNDKSMSGTSSSTEMRTSAGADDCSHCPGKQTANADGTCPVCHAKVK